MKRLELLKCLNCNSPLHWGDSEIIKCPYCESEYIKDEGITISEKPKHQNIDLYDINLDDSTIKLNIYGHTFECYIGDFEIEYQPDIEVSSLYDYDYEYKQVIHRNLPNINMRLICMKEIGEEKDE